MGYMSFAEYLDNYIREMLYAPIRAEEEAAMIRDREYQRREYIARRLGWRTPKDEAHTICYIARGGVIRPRRLILKEVNINE